MADIEGKSGGFGSIPGDLFDGLIQHFDSTPTMPSTLEPFRHEILVQLAKTEHAAANAKKLPYVVDVVFKCVSIQSNFLTAKDPDPSIPDSARKQALQNIVATLKALAQLWV